MRINQISLGVATFLLMGASVWGQSSSAASPETRNQDKQTQSKPKKSKAAEKQGTSGKNDQTTKENTRDRANDPQMPKNDGLTQDPTRPGTPPTFPRKEPLPNTPVKPPDPTAPTTVKP